MKNGHRSDRFPVGAAALGISQRRVRQLITDQRLPAEKKGRDYLISEKDLKLVADRKPGRPSTNGKVKR